MSKLLILWDALFACGIHMNIIFTVSHMILLRDDLLSGGHAKVQSMLWFYKNVPELDPDVLVSLSLHIVKKLPADLYQKLENHPYLKVEV